MYCNTSLKGAKRIDISEDMEKTLEHYLSRKPAAKKTEQEPEIPKPRNISSARPHLRVIPGGKSPNRTPAPKPVSAPKKSGQPRHLVVIWPHKLPSKDAVKGMGKLMGWDKFITAQRLKAEYPWIAKRFAEGKSAATLSKELIAFGIKSYVISEQIMENAPEKHKVTKLWLTNDGILFKDASRASLEVKLGNVFLAVKGIVRRKHIKESKEVSILTKRYDKDDKKVDKWKGQVMDIYFINVDKAVRLIDGEVDFSGLKDEMSPSSSINMTFVLDRLLGDPPCAEVDETFKKHAAVLSRSASGEGVMSDALSKGKGKSQSTEKLDNLAQFDEHSALMYVHTMRAATTLDEDKPEGQ